MEKEIYLADYRKAQAEERYRQLFLNSIISTSLEAYVTKLVYIPFVNGGSVMRTIPAYLTNLFGIKSLRSKIVVYPVAFDYRLDDFLGVLFFHEAHHAKEIYENPGDCITSFWQSLKSLSLSDPMTAMSDFERNKNRIGARREIRAYENQLSNIGALQFSDKYRKDVLNGCDLIYW